MSRRVALALWTLGWKSLLTFLLLFSSVVAAQYTYLSLRPLHDLFEYRWVEQVGDAVRPSGPFVLQSGVAIHQPLRLEYDMVLRCRPAAGGPERTASKLARVFQYDAPRALGLADDATLTVGYEHTDGEWNYRGDLPDEDSRCRLTITPCALLEYNIRRCQRSVRSEPIMVQEAASL